MNKLVNHGLQIEIQMESYEVYLKPKIETYMIWGDIILHLAKNATVLGPIELGFTGICHTLWPQGRKGDLTHTRNLHSIQLSIPPPASSPNLQAGKYHLPFEFPIPGTLPPTICLNNGYISYKLTARLHRPGALFSTVSTSAPIFFIRYPDQNPLDMRYVSVHRYLQDIECDIAFDCAAAILGHHIGVDLSIHADNGNRSKVKSVLFTITEKCVARIQEEHAQRTEHRVAVLKWAYHHTNPDVPYTEGAYMNLKELNWDLSTPLQGRFVFPVPSCQFILQPTISSRDIVITHWAKLTVHIERDGETHQALLESPFEILSCRLAPVLNESPPRYEECAKADVAVRYEHNADACPCTRKDKDRKQRGKTTIARILPRYQLAAETALFS